MKPCNQCRFCKHSLVKIPVSFKRFYCSEKCFSNYWQNNKREYHIKNYPKHRARKLETNRLWRIRHPNYKKEWDKKNKEHIRNYLKKYLEIHGPGSRHFYKYPRYYGLTFEQYKKITKKCSIRNCHFSETVDLHHIDKNRNNNNISNLIGLCPNHHQLIHRLKYKLIRKRRYWVLVK